MNKQLKELMDYIIRAKNSDLPKSTPAVMIRKASIREDIARLRSNVLGKLFNLSMVDDDAWWQAHDNIEMIEHCIRLGYEDYAISAIKMLDKFLEDRRIG